MKLYTFQPNFIWETIQKDGYFHPFDLFEKNESLKEDFTHHWGFAQSYQWLREQMIKKNISYKNNNSHLIWTWYQWFGDKKKPDKRYASVFNFYEEPFVMLELEVDENRVCLTDYDLWHYVLNYWYIESEEISENFSQKFNFYKQKPLKNKKARNTLEKSWEKIFDLEESKKFMEIDKSQQVIQATLFELFLEDVKKVHYFENKKCIKIEKIKSP